MVRSVLVGVFSISVAMAGFSWAETVQEQWNLHAEANKCINEPCQTSECTIECDQICLTCHKLILGSNLSGTTPWNSSGRSIEEVYAPQTPSDVGKLSDKCKDCHQGHFIAGGNHPVEIAYPPARLNTDLQYSDSPDGPLLLCEKQDDCTMSCVSCHKVHPSEEKGNQLAALLRVNTQRSKLCLSCHNL